MTDWALSKLSVQDSSALLDIGCGAGEWSIAACLNGIQKVDGIDLQHEMIEIGIRRGSDRMRDQLDER